MKRLNLILIIVGCLFEVACSGPAGDTGRFEGTKVTIEKGGICLTSERLEDCNRSTERVYWLHGGRKGLKMETFLEETTNRPVNWVSYKTSDPIKEGVYSLEDKNGRLVMEMGREKIETATEQGILFYLDRKGQVSIMKLQKKDVPLHKIQLKEKQIFQDGISFGNKMLIGTAPVIEQMSRKSIQVIVQGDINSRIIPNDTGTEIILEDILRALNCCDAAEDLDCCEGGGGKGKGVTIEKEPKSYRALDIPRLKEMSEMHPVQAMASTIISGSWKTILTVEAANVCLYRSGPYLIIIDCISGDIWCLDSDECIILLQSNAEGEIAVMVKEECTAFDNIVPCT